MEQVVLTNMCLIENSETGEVVVINRKKDWKGLAFPGGHIEQGEPIVPSVVREVKEETGLDISNLEFCGIRDWYDGRINERNVVFMFKTSTYTGTLIDKTHEGEVFWRKLNDIKDEEYAEGLNKELSLFFKKDVNECYSSYDENNDVWLYLDY